MLAWWRRRRRLAKFALASTFLAGVAFVALACVVWWEKSRVAAMDARLRRTAESARLEPRPSFLRDRPAWLKRTLPDLHGWLDRACATHHEVFAHYCDLDDAAMAFLTPRAEVTLYAPGNVRLTDAAFTRLGNARDLSMVDLSGAGGVGDATAARLAERHAGTLRHLVFGRTGVGDDGLARLAGAAKLEFLDLAHTRVTDAGLPALEGAAALENLALDGLPITDAGAESLARIRSGMRQRLSLAGAKLTDAGVAKLRNAGWRTVRVGSPNIQAVRLAAWEVRAAGAGYPPGTRWIAGRFRIDEPLAGPVTDSLENVIVDGEAPAEKTRTGAAYLNCGSHGHQATLKRHSDGTWAFEVLAQPADFAPGESVSIVYLTPHAVRGWGGVEYVVDERTLPKP